MAFLVVQAGNTLYKVDPTSGTATALTLPTGVTLDTAVKPKFAVLNEFVAIVNSPTRNLVIDAEGLVKVMVPRAPVSPPVIAAGASTGLTGVYKIKCSFVVFDSVGRVIMESPLSPESQPVTLANQNLSLTRCPVSEDAISARRFYRTAAGGSEYFFLQDLTGNETTAFINNLSDASLALLPEARDLVGPPGTLSMTKLRNICAWKNRLWATPGDEVDSVYYTEDGSIHMWPNIFEVMPKGADAEGVVAFAPRENELGILKRTGLWQITGDSNDDFAIVQITQGKDTPGKGGCIAPDSVCVINDKVYWLGRDGVYEWGETLKNVSDEKVKGWFTSDTYFNRSRFPNAFAKYNEVLECYELHLAAVGSSVEDRWVQLNLRNRRWYGPHKTDLFTPSHGIHAVDSNTLPIAIVGGSNGILYTANSSLFRDGAATSIDMDVVTRFHHGDAPDVEHYWGLSSILTKVLSVGTLTITPYLGDLEAISGAAFLHDMTLGREVIGRVGFGRMLKLRFQQNTVNVGGVIYGYEVPFHEVARR